MPLMVAQEVMATMLMIQAPVSRAVAIRSSGEQEVVDCLTVVGLGVVLEVFREATVVAAIFSSDKLCCRSETRQVSRLFDSDENAPRKALSSMSFPGHAGGGRGHRLAG